MTRIIVRPAAERDIREACEYYEDEAQLGDAFLDEVSKSLERLQFMQHRFPEVRPGVRRTIMSRFPYSVYFRVTDEVTVLAVLHMKRATSLVTARTR